MIVFIRTAVIASGKMGDALPFANEIAGYIKGKYGLEIQVLVPVGGNPSRIAWSAQYENLNELDSMTMNLMGDPDYATLVAKSTDYFLPGSINDEMWRST